jgi:hypothetical protein
MSAALSQEERAALIPASFWDSHSTTNSTSSASLTGQQADAKGHNSKGPCMEQGTEPQQVPSAEECSITSDGGGTEAAAYSQQGSSRSTGDALSRLQACQEAQRLAALPPIFKPPTEKVSNCMRTVDVVQGWGDDKVMGSRCS